ncbi:ABC transporter substrate-binding protein [Pararhizobium sp.]|uniref:ABC transporter substrate-binding protein n=1 Tax=Pararhizobium sp. TaxID=1977563 RepID=UPI0027223AB2|nr:ABC transporter substrate-binding protein [Pararhizobium sp.]MDO9417806.1 ABC transporter substrate-binding protein [Pararhizobium sp.]
MRKSLFLASSVIAIATAVSSSQAAEVKQIGISVQSMGDPFLQALVNGATTEAKSLNPDVDINASGFDYDLGKQFIQIDNFIAAGVQLILLNPGDPKAIGPAIKKAHDAGIPVVAVDTAAEGADATVTTDNIKAGEISCQFIVDKLAGKGDVVIINGPQVSSVIDRVKGCKDAFAKAPGINILSADQDGKGTREGALGVMGGLLTRFDKIDAVFTINDSTAVGADLAGKQQNRTEYFISSVDGSPDFEEALKSNPNTLIKASAAQNPYEMARKATKVGFDIVAGKKPENPVELMTPVLITADNIAGYKGWSANQ